MPIVYTHRVRYHEVDQQGFLFNGHYLAIADVAMAELFGVLGWRYDALVAGGVDPSVVKAQLNFRLPAVFDDEIVVDTTPVHVGRSSFTLSSVLRRAGQIIATIENVYVNVDSKAARSRPLPAEISSALTRLCVTGQSGDRRADATPVADS
jgi:acyl-CoA thioester hydrolase